MKKKIVAILLTLILALSLVINFALPAGAISPNYAVAVVEVVGTFGAPTALSSDSSVAEGIVTGAPNQTFIQISNDSSITLSMDDPITVDDDLNTSDLTIDTYDAPFPAAAKVEVSADGTTCVEVTGRAGNDCDPTRLYVYDDLPGGAIVDLTQTGLTTVQYIRLTDYPASIDGETSYPLLGFDLDALVEEHLPIYPCNVVPTKIGVSIDIKPTSCPNPLNVGSNGVVSVAILGTEDFDVNEVDPGVMLLEGVASLRWSIEDVAAPYVPDG